MAKIDRIKVSAEFPGIWLTAEANVAPDENPIEEFKKTRQTILDAYKEMAEPKLVPISEALGITQVNRSREKEISDLLEMINLCPTIKNLNTYANSVQRLNEQVLYDAFNNKKKELQ